VALQHTSYPGFYGATLPGATGAALAAVADALVPGDGEWPSASAAGVVRWIEERISPADADWFGELLGGAAGDAAAWLHGLESARPVDFATLRAWVYRAYYATPLALEALRRAGSDYHGAPQPWGYDIAQYEQAPSARRGSYIRTEEARRVLL
jgi:hypothetical protein